MNKKKIIIIVIVILAVLFIPSFPGTVFRDGGTRELKALAYKIVIWNRLTEDGVYHKTRVYFFPKNMKSIDELWEEESVNVETDVQSQISGKTFTREKGGFGGDFTITLNEGGSYTYYEGFLSSYIGMGNWSVKDRILIMNETGGLDRTYLFYVKNGELVFIKEGSGRFLYTSVEDGERFIPN